jgi:hypothetical protein
MVRRHHPGRLDGVDVRLRREAAFSEEEEEEEEGFYPQMTRIKRGF